jgi:nuclear pore complex protein Nup98-Nup96
MLTNVTFKLTHAAPFVTHTSVPFSKIGKFDNSTPTDDDHDVQHITAYKLGHLLFDNYDDRYSYGFSEAQRKHYDYRIRRDRLTEFLSTLLAYDTSTYENIPTDAPNYREQLAVVDLSKHDINSAVECLKDNKDNHLALLVSQLDQADESFQEDMSTQMKDWHEQNIISEMSDPIRALYSILSGNTSTVKGKPSGPLEDRSSTFAISERFNLNWLQAFCLTLWYGKSKNDSIEDSIIEFAEKLEGGEEIARPVSKSGKEDILWVLLKLYASRKGQMTRPMLPQAISESSLAERPMDSYYVFTMHHALIAKLGPMGEVAVDNEAADQLAADVAFEVSSTMDAGKQDQAIANALFALLHIDNAESREASVKDLLNRFAAYLPGETETLGKSLKIPAAWIWEAKAQYARSGHDGDNELSCLIKANLYEAAHECLCREAALSQFPERAPVKEWAGGGGVYSLFVQAVSKVEKGDLDALQASLVDIGRMNKASIKSIQGSEKMGVEELRVHIAVREMSRVVAGMLGERNAAAILPLPITSDARLRETRALAVEYYRRIMSR